MKFNNDERFSYYIEGNFLDSYIEGDIYNSHYLVLK